MRKERRVSGEVGKRLSYFRLGAVKRIQLLHNSKIIFNMAVSGKHIILSTFFISSIGRHCYFSVLIDWFVLSFSSIFIMCLFLVFLLLLYIIFCLFLQIQTQSFKWLSIVVILVFSRVLTICWKVAVNLRAIAPPISRNVSSELKEWKWIKTLQRIVP